MSHITIIISKVASPSDGVLDSSYEYCIPVPHGASPKKVGEMTSRAYRHLEGELATPEKQEEKAEE